MAIGQENKRITSEKPISPEQLQAAVKNYLHCLNLPELGQVLIITDRLPIGTKNIPDPNLLIRRKMAGKIEEQLTKDKQPVVRVEYDDLMDGESFYNQTKRAVEELDQLTAGEKNISTTIVYLGDVYTNRSGIYNAANWFGEKREVRVAGSLGFSSGDCRVMSEMDENHLQKISDNNQYFENFFKEKPKGRFRIFTCDENNHQYRLNLPYDVAKAQFETDLGRFSELETISIGNFHYVNIPGGEKCGAPFPLSEINGKFYAEGVFFLVNKGLVINAQIMEGKKLKDFELSQQQLIEIVQNGGKMPVAELGLGFYQMVGIKTYADCSTLSREKTGPHIGIGHHISPSPEESLVSELAGNFRHTDFVLNKPTLVWADLNSHHQQPFYPPPK